MIYTIYLPNGQIVKVVNTNNVEEQLASNESFIVGDYADNKFYIENMKAIELPVSPGNYYVFDYESKTWIDKRTPEQKYNDAAEPIISERNNLLYASDWTQIPNNPLTAEQQAAWATYRQQLRDITSQSGYPFNIIWPTPPQG